MTVSTFHDPFSSIIVAYCLSREKRTLHSAGTSWTFDIPFRFTESLEGPSGYYLGSVQHLEPAPFPDPFDRETQDLQPTFDERFPNETGRHDVAKVLDVRHRRLGRYRTPTKEYLTQLENIPIEKAERVKERDVVGAEEKITEFLQSQL